MFGNGNHVLAGFVINIIPNKRKLSPVVEQQVSNQFLSQYPLILVLSSFVSKHTRARFSDSPNNVHNEIVSDIIIVFFKSLSQVWYLIILLFDVGIA